MYETDSRTHISKIEIQFFYGKILGFVEGSAADVLIIYVSERHVFRF